MKIHQKLVTIVQALETLERSITLFQEWEQKKKDLPTHENEEIAVSMRDSMIQRFEYCSDLLWKTLKYYLQEVENVVLSSLSPRGVVRQSVGAKEEPGKVLLRSVWVFAWREWGRGLLLLMPIWVGPICIPCWALDLQTLP